MLERIKLWFFKNKTWIYNIQYILYSIVLLIFVIFVDLGYYNIQDHIPDFFFTSIDLSKTILATLAGAQLTITTFTFSTILTVMSNYISNYSPRVLENFVDRKITMKVLGIFFGGFFYSITALVFMRDAIDDGRVIAGFVGVVYAIISMIYFIVFVQNVIYSSKSDNLILDIYKKTLVTIKEELDKRSKYKGLFEEDKIKQIKLYPNTNGFLSAIDYKTILEDLKDKKCELIIESKIGDFLNVEKPIAHINIGDRDSFDDETMEKIAKSFVLSNRKVYENDYRHGIDKIEEIGIRALSPGINDPNTAINCVHKISLLLTHLSKTDNYNTVRSKGDRIKISYTSNSFQEDMYASFNQFINYGAEDVDLIYSVFEGLETLYHSSTDNNKKAVKNYLEDIYYNIIPQPKGRLDRLRLKKFIDRIIDKN